MSKRTKIKFGVILLLLIVLPMPYNVVNLICNTEDEVEEWILQKSYGSFILLFVIVFLVYAIGTVSAVKVVCST